MKILYAYRYGIVGGVSTQLLLRKRALEKAGHECELFFSQDNGLSDVLPLNTAGVYFGGFAVFRKLKKKKYDAIIIVDTPELLKIAIRYPCRNSKVYLDVHTTTENGLSYLNTISLEKIDGVMVPSSYSKSLIEERRPDCLKRLHIVPNILDLDVFSLKTVNSNIFCNNEVPHFIWVGKLDKHKNWRSALVYARMLKTLFTDIRFYVVGGYTAQDSIANAFFELIYRLKISDVVIWLDQVEKLQLAKIYQQCAETGGAMFITSRDESFGMAAAEALLCGCPIVSNNLPVFREVFPESPMLQLVDIWQPEQVAEAFKQIASNQITGFDKEKVCKELSSRYSDKAFLIALEKSLRLKV